MGRESGLSLTAPEQLGEVFELSTRATLMFESAGEDDVVALGASCLLSTSCRLAAVVHLLRDGSLGQVRFPAHRARPDDRAVAAGMPALQGRDGRLTCPAGPVHGRSAAPQ
ncbi:hypothetical protein ACFVIL_34990 [Streptomyces sp. NPDC127159]|uniref:hypothetical protein n=1 Tax=unclassified Streptomyces TaxID=2593676 RepID=UPI00363BA4C7